MNCGAPAIWTLVAILMFKPAGLTLDELDGMVQSVTFTEVQDWFSNYVIKKHPEKESLRVRWMASAHPMTLRAGWSLTAGRVAREPEGLDITGLLDRIEAEMAEARPEAQWTMNTTLANIGIHHPTHRARALAIGETLGVYRDYPTSKGCTSPFAPEWIGEMVRRQEAGA